MRHLYLHILLVTCCLLPAACAAQIITTVAGNGTGGFSGDGGQATNAELNYPEGVTFDAYGNLYIADYYNNRIRKINTAGIIFTIAGNGTQGYSGDGGQATNAELYYPSGVTFDAVGNLYISDSHNNCVRKVILSTGIILTIAGTGICCSNLGDGGEATAAELGDPTGITFDAIGNLYIADYGNNRIRTINTAGIINTIAGNGAAGYYGDGGQATAAELYVPDWVAFDSKGNLYIVDAYNQRIRMVNTSGIISTVAGNGTIGYSGDGGQATVAELDDLAGVALDASSNLYISGSNDRIRKIISSTGIICTIAGNGTAGFSGDGGQAIAAELYGSVALTFDVSGNLFISDAGNNRIRKVTNVGQMGLQQVAGINNQVLVYPNPVSNSLQVSFTGNIQNMSIEIYNMMGESVLRQSTTSPLPPSKGETFVIDMADFKEGVYLLKIETNEGIETKKIIKQ